MTFTKDDIIEILKHPGGVTEYKGRRWANRTLVYRMLQAMYNRQTQFEQEIKGTVIENGIGFNGVDANFLSSVAENSKQYGNLTGKQCDKVAAKLIKYAGQLQDIALSKLQQSLPMCGYCSKVGHVQIDCPTYKKRELGRPMQQQELISTHQVPE